MIKVQLVKHSNIIIKKLYIYTHMQGERKYSKWREAAKCQQPNSPTVAILLSSWAIHQQRRKDRNYGKWTPSAQSRCQQHMLLIAKAFYQKRKEIRSNPLTKHPTKVVRHICITNNNAKIIINWDLLNISQDFYHWVYTDQTEY